MSKVPSRRTISSCIGAILLGSLGIAMFSGETVYSAIRFFVIPSAFVISQFAYARMGREAGFGTAIALAVPIMTLAATTRFLLWPNESESAIVYIGITGVTVGLLWGAVMPIFTAPYDRGGIR
jgi:hypothetical protein